MTQPRIVKTVAFLAIAALLWAPFSSVPEASAAVGNWQKGVSVIPANSGDFGSSNFQQSMRNFKAAGGTHVDLIIPYYQSNSGSTDIQSGYNTPSDSSLISGIQFAHSIGLKVELSIYLENWSGEWRALISPGDRDTWYSRYGDVLVHYGTIASQQGVEQYSLGAELVKMTSAAINGDNTQRWNGMIARVRGVYGGTLTYSANRGTNDWASELPNIQFWDKLDLIGVSAYYELPGDGSVASLEGDWQNVNNYDINPIQSRWHKPVIFTEVGYRSVSGAHNQPWNSGMGGSYDPQEQVNDYTALFDYWNNYSYMQGVYLWAWSSDPNYGGSGNTDYTPQNKPAQQTMQQWFGMAPSPQQTGTPTAAAAGTAAPSSATPGTSVSLGATVRISTAALSGGVVDIEVYNGANTKVFQQFFENQNINAGASKQYSVPWTPTSQDTYRMTIGVFSAGWAQNYTWNNSAATIAVGTGGSTPPPPPTSSGVTNIWWPTDGSHVTGVQPFKAMVEGIDVSQYSMWWQVDGGALVQMANSTTDYPHKEALVDLSGWNWKGNGPYTVTFVSKDSSGAEIGRKSINIYIP